RSLPCARRPAVVSWEGSAMHRHDRGMRAARAVARCMVPAAFAVTSFALAPPAKADDADEIRKLREDLDAERRARAELASRLATVEKDAGRRMTDDEISAQIERYMQDKEM